MIRQKITTSSHEHTHTHECPHTHTRARTSIYIHTYIHAYVHTYTHTYVHAYIHTTIHTYIHTYIRTCIHTYIHAYTHTHTCTHTQALTRHTSVHTYIHTYIQTNKQTHMHTYIHWHERNGASMCMRSKAEHFQNIGNIRDWMAEATSRRVSATLLGADPQHHAEALCFYFSLSFLSFCRAEGSSQRPSGTRPARPLFGLVSGRLWGYSSLPLSLSLFRSSSPATACT